MGRNPELQPLRNGPSAEAGHMGLSRKPSLDKRRRNPASYMDRYPHHQEQRNRPRQRELRGSSADDGEAQQGLEQGVLEAAYRQVQKQRSAPSEVDVHYRVRYS